MDCYNEPYNEPCPILCIDELEKKSRKISTSTRATIAAGNSVVLFSMLLLEEILKILALNPITNLSSIIAVSNAIASLNSSIKIDP